MPEDDEDKSEAAVKKRMVQFLKAPNRDRPDVQRRSPVPPAPLSDEIQRLIEADPRKAMECERVCHECLRPCIILRSSPKGNARTCAECFDSNRAVWEAASEADKADLECKRKPETLLQRAVRDYEQQERLRHFKLEVKRIMDEQSQQQQQQQQ